MHPTPKPGITARGFVFVLAWAVGLGVLGLMLLGIPGGLLLQLAIPLIRFIWWIPANQPVMVAEAGWPLALDITFLWPAALVVSYVLTTRAGMRGRRRALYMALGTLVGAILITVLVFAVMVGNSAQHTR